MKKTSIVMLAVLGLSGIVHAASVQWGMGGTANSTTLTLPDNVTYAKGVPTYLFLASDRATVEAALAAGTFNTVAGSSVELKNTAGTTGRITNHATTSESLTGTSASLFIVAWDSATITSGSSKYILGDNLSADVYSGTAVPTVKPNWLYSSTGGADNFGTWQNYGPIPEPTSLALLAIGAAAIGLRRKFRK